MVVRTDVRIQKMLLLFAFLLINTVFLKGQSGWVNSIGFYTVNWKELKSHSGERYVMQIEYLRFKLVKPRLGVGGGVALKESPTHGLERRQQPRTNLESNDFYTHYRFAELFAYAKGYLTHKRWLYVDARIGYAQPLGDIPYTCYNCNGYGILYERYSPGPTMQAGIGIQSTSSKAIRTGFKLSYYQTYFKRQLDIHPDYWESTTDGVIKRESSSQALKRLVLGISLYF